MKLVSPKRGEIWLTDFNPTVGAEIEKIRPAVVISSDAISVAPIKLVAPVRNWKDLFAGDYWHVRIVPDRSNNLEKISSIDALQLRGVDPQRLLHKIGRVSSDKMEEIATAVAAVVEYE